MCKGGEAKAVQLMEVLFADRMWLFVLVLCIMKVR